MRNFLLTSSLVCSILLLTGAMDPQALFSGSLKEENFLPRGREVSGEKFMKGVLHSLRPDRVQWLAMTVQQKSYGDDPFEAEGRYLLGPNQRMRLDLHIKASGKEGRVLAVCDGRNLWQGRWLDGDREAPTVQALPSEGPNQGPLRDLFLHARGLGGLVPLMQGINQCLKNPLQQAGLFRDRPAIQLTGDWNAAEEVLKTIPADLRARRCNLVVDAETLWPCRVEWLGSPCPGNYPILLMRLDFRAPVFNRPLSPLEMAREFRFPC